MEHRYAMQYEEIPLNFKVKNVGENHLLVVKEWNIQVMRHSRMRKFKKKNSMCAEKPCDTGGRIIARKERGNGRTYLTLTTDQSLSILTGCSRWTGIATIAATHTTGWACLLKMKRRRRTRSQRRRRSNTCWRYGTIGQHLGLCLTWEITRPSDPWRRRSPRISVCAWQFFGWDCSCEWGCWCCWCSCWGSGW